MEQEIVSLKVSLAYKFVAMLVLLVEVNQYIETLDLQIERPVTVSQISGTRSTVSPPGLLGFTGSILTPTYFFGFIEGRLRYIHHTDDLAGKIFLHDPGSDAEGCRTNQAYSLGLKLLADLQMDTAALEKLHPPSLLVCCPSGDGRSRRNRRGEAPAPKV